MDENTRRRCAGCAHFYLAADPRQPYGTLPACVYILHTGKRRPCPAGPGCTAFAPAPARRPGLRAYARFWFRRRRAPAREQAGPRARE